MTFAIRQACPQDAALLPAIEISAGDAFRDVPGLGWIADADVMSIDRHRDLIVDGTSWVAVDAGDAPIGFVAAEACGSELHVWEASVRHDRQGEGVGRALMQTLIAHARDADFAAVTLTTFRDLAWNERFYAGLGFVTLDPGSSGARLSNVLAAEAEHGLPAERRCAMRLALRAG